MTNEDMDAILYVGVSLSIIFLLCLALILRGT